MKITKRQLRQIIQEERANLVSEVRHTNDADRRRKEANLAAVREELTSVLEMLESFDRVDLEELRAVRTGHWSDEMINKLADMALVRRMDSAYMGG